MVPQTAASTDFTPVNNAKVIDGLLASLSVATAITTQTPGAAASTDFVTPNNGRIIDAALSSLASDEFEPEPERRYGDELNRQWQRRLRYYRQCDGCDQRQRVFVVAREHQSDSGARYGHDERFCPGQQWQGHRHAGRDRERGQRDDESEQRNRDQFDRQRERRLRECDERTRGDQRNGVVGHDRERHGEPGPGHRGLDGLHESNNGRVIDGSSSNSRSRARAPRRRRVPRQRRAQAGAPTSRQLAMPPVRSTARCRRRIGTTRRTSCRRRRSAARSRAPMICDAHERLDDQRHVDVGHDQRRRQRWPVGRDRRRRRLIQQPDERVHAISGGTMTTGNSANFSSGCFLGICPSAELRLQGYPAPPAGAPIARCELHISPVREQHERRQPQDPRREFVERHVVHNLSGGDDELQRRTSDRQHRPRELWRQQLRNHCPRS